MTRQLMSTYRLQLGPGFTLQDARGFVPYFARLGVSHLYLSPLLAARAGSTHGYDVIDYARMNSELGDEDDLRALASDLAARDMGIVLDIVPNHMAAVTDNRAWSDVLTRGRASRYAEWFDIDWEAPRAAERVVLPVLGDEMDRVLARNEMRLDVSDTDVQIAYFDKRFPVDPATLPPALQLGQLDPAARIAASDWHKGVEGLRRMRALLDAQHYRLVSFRRVKELNYRRFFDVADLIAMRMETDAVFDATHALIVRWIGEGLVQGLRVDHVDGLASPAWYLAKLRAAVDAAAPGAASTRVPIFVEKILSGPEALPRDWPVEGTTGYDFMSDAADLFLDATGFGQIEANYRGLRHNPSLRFAAIARESKRRVLEGALAPDVARVARLAHAWRPAVSEADAATAITEMIAGLDVYRTYVAEPGEVSDADAAVLRRAVGAARETSTPPKAVAMLTDAFFAPPDAGDLVRAELVARFQQTSGPAAAKGVEDTALYVYIPLASRNEVGGTPDAPLADAVERVHARNAARARDWPQTLTATNTHDTKRSADLRARMSVLTAHPAEWARHVGRWRRLNRRRKRVVGGRPSPDTNTEYLYYQTLVGIWPLPPERRGRRLDDLPIESWLEQARGRLTGYMLKAARESKTRTSWTDRDAQYESALEAFVRETVVGNPEAPFLSDVARMSGAVADDGFAGALARIMVHQTAPGTPDVYQGDELWTFTLVDPDNRRPVDFAARARLLDECADTSAILRQAFEGRRPLSDDVVKLALTTRLLRFRAEHARLFREGEYLPVRASRAHMAFVRRLGGAASLTVVRTIATDATEVATLELPRELSGVWTSALTQLAVRADPDASGRIVLPVPGASARQWGDVLYKSTDEHGPDSKYLPAGQA